MKQRRTCLCGCGSVYAVDTSNVTNFFAGLDHAYWARKRRDSVGEAARKLLSKNQAKAGTDSLYLKRKMKFERSQYEPTNDDAIEAVSDAEDF